MSSHDVPSDLWRLSAAQAVALLRAREVSPLELVEAAAARIAETEPHINALPTLCLERARDHARRIMDRPSAQDQAPWLGGLPVAVKDLEDVAGVRTTYGSPIYAAHVPEVSDHTVQRLEARGAIVIGKSNTPEFGAGASTFNEVFGRTRNPWNTTKSVAGSSGGAAAALAAGQVWLATGSDLGGSLRTPASFNGVIGLRPSPGRVPRGPKELPFQNLSVGGPMARTAMDTALFLDALSGWHGGDPQALPAPEESFVDSLKVRRLPRRVAFTPNLGCLPVEREVAEICAAAAGRFAEHGIAVEEATPDFSEAVETFQVLRAALFAAEFGPTLERHRDRLKPEVIWNVEKGMALDAAAIGRAELARGRLFQGMARFFETYDLLLCPAAAVAPFPVEVRYIEEIEGHRFDNYIDWVGLCSAITLTACPALSAPAGLTADGLPVGLQIVGPPRGEAAALTGALLLEELTGLHELVPRDPAAGT